VNSAAEQIYGAANWFTSSTSFANPAVTVGRMFSDSSAGIAPGSAPGFIVAALIGLALIHRVRQCLEHPGQLSGRLSFSGSRTSGATSQHDNRATSHRRALGTGGGALFQRVEHRPGTTPHAEPPTVRLCWR
jgi:hypothetical protein